MSQDKPTELAIPTDAVPAMQKAAAALSNRLGRDLNYAQVYIAFSSARSSGALDEIGCRDFVQQPTDPRLIETVALLLERHPELLDELQKKAKLQGFE